MRSQFILRRTRAFKPPTFAPRALLSSTRVPRYPRKENTARSSIPKLTKRSSSSAPPVAPEPDPDVPDESPEVTADAPDEESPPDATAEEGEKPKRRARASTAKDSDAAPPLPDDLNILWSPDSHLHVDPSTSSSFQANSALPPPEIFHEVLTNLHITLHPQTQHRAAYASTSGPPIEPTLALYCPIEGGDYIIDETVRELGRQAGAEVVVLDSVQIAAGECGQFGKAASVLRLPNNPLHFSSPSSSRAPSLTFEDEEDDDMPSRYPTSSQLTLHVLAPASRSSRLVAARRTGNPSMAKVKAFFDELINVSAPIVGGATEPPPRLPRIIYIRDFPTLAPSSATWYPALLAAVRARRQGPLARQSSPVYNPTTIVFGITPSIVASSTESSHSGSPPGLLNLLMSKQNVAQGVSGSRVGKSDYSEDEFSEKARERRLRERLRKWERGDRSLHDELPHLTYAHEDDPSRSGSDSKVVVVGDDQFSNLPPMVAQAIQGRLSARGSGQPEGEQNSQFFRTSIIVPSIRSLLLEKACRMDRRREINELTMRMGIAAVGGTLDKLSPTPDDIETSEALEEGPDPAARRMWEEWGRSVELWANVRQIADRAVGKVIAAGANARHSGAKSPKPSLDPTPVEWDVVYEAWTVHKAARDMRKAWILQSSGKATQEPDEDEDETPSAEIDEVIERVKRDPDLEQHEQRLLGCIVDTRTITTTFSHVHLPARTIDSVRTIVSLPLLHPSAFQHGILKEHAMTGCLLFGPPGTGKTLVVRALAKEAGCRMLAVSPSDVMDMYVGEGEKLVRSVFSLARRLSPCVVFIDEIDALFGARMGARESGGAIAHRGVITEFMQEMDGLKSSKDDNIIVIGATNRPFDLDDAVLRRLPRRLLVDLPGEKEREEILKILLRDEPLAPDVDLKVLGHKTEGFSGSDLKHLCVSAALDAVKERVDVPWRPSKKAPEGDTTAAEAAGTSSSADVESPAPLSSASDNHAEGLPSPEVTESTASEPAAPTAAADETQSPRILHWRHFAAALKEITPSASEALGSLADLRKWNEEFGEGRSERKKQVWGKGRFGFTTQILDGNGGKVRSSTSSGPASSGGTV